MLGTTKDLIRSALKTDPTLSARAQRNALLALASAEGGHNPPSLILRPKDAAKLLAITPRTLLNLQRRGALHPVKLPGNQRALGYRRDEIEALAEVAQS